MLSKVVQSIAHEFEGVYILVGLELGIEVFGSIVVIGWILSPKEMEKFDSISEEL